MDVDMFAWTVLIDFEHYMIAHYMYKCKIKPIFVIL